MCVTCDNVVMSNNNYVFCYLHIFIIQYTNYEVENDYKN